MRLSSARHPGSALLVSIMSLALIASCGSDADGDAPCPDGTWRSGSGCIDNGMGPADTGADAGPGSDVGPAPDTSGTDTTSDTSIDVTSDAGPDVLPTDSGSSADVIRDTVVEDTGATTPTTLPFAVDNYYAPSGFMGDGAIAGGITLTDDACGSARAGDGQGICRSFTWTRGSNGWGGVFWQYPDGNWGDAPGLAVPAGATEVTFYAWGETGDEVINFLVGIGDVDGFAAESGGIALGTEPTRYSVSLEGLSVGAEVVGAFGWVTDSGDSATFTVDDIQWR